MVVWTKKIPLDSKEIKPGNHPKYSLEGLMLKLKLQYFGHLMGRTDSFEKTLMLGTIEGMRRRGRQRMRRLDGISDSMDLNLSEFWELVMDREAWCAAIHGVTKSQTWLSNFTFMTEQLHFLSLSIYIITVFKITKCQCTSSLLLGELQNNFRWWLQLWN